MNKGDHRGQLVGFQNGMQPVSLRDANKVSTQFDGINERVNIDGLATAISTSTVGTLSAWVRPVRAIPASNDRILHFSDSTSGDYLDFYGTNQGYLKADFRVGGVYQWRIRSSSQLIFTDNEWTHVAVIQDGLLRPVLYADGVKLSYSISGADNTAWFADFASPVDLCRVGCYSASGAVDSLFYEGNIDEVSVYNKVKHIGELWNGTGRPTQFAGEIGLMGKYKMGDGDRHPLIMDHSGNGYHGTMINMTQGNFTRAVA